MALKKKIKQKPIATNYVASKNNVKSHVKIPILIVVKRTTLVAMKKVLKTRTALIKKVSTNNNKLSSNKVMEFLFVI
jgi:hypothetical protein